MSILIILFAVFTLFTGIVIMVNPEVIFAMLRKNIDKQTLYALAVGIRIVLGVLLIEQSSVSEFPLVIGVLGWLSFIAALILAAMGREKFTRLMSWALSVPEVLSRVGGVFTAIFGGFLLYAFI